MTWINDHKQYGRAVVLVLLVTAIMGPWWFDEISVPAEYPCSIRLEGDFCGVPSSGAYVLLAVGGGIIQVVVGLVTGSVVLSDVARLFLFDALVLLLVLPFFSTIFTILRGGRRRQQVFNITAWGLAVGAGVLWGITIHPKLFLALWGGWLYIGLAVSALSLELIAWRNQAGSDM